MAKESIKESGADKGLHGIGFSLVADVSGEKFQAPCPVLFLLEGASFEREQLQMLRQAHFDDAQCRQHKKNALCHLALYLKGRNFLDNKYN